MVEEKRDRLEMEGTVEKCLGNSMFLVRVSENHTVLCTLSGKIKINNIKILINDMVNLEASPFDLSRGRITYRRK